MPILRTVSNIDKVGANFRQFGDTIGRTARTTFNRVVTRIKQKMQRPGKPITYPVRWDSEKQKRAYFATNGFGAGIPYRRTQRYELGWKVKEIKNGVILSNAHPAAAVGGNERGTWQSKIHRGRWQAFSTAVADELKRLPQEVRDSINILFKGERRAQ